MTEPSSRAGTTLGPYRIDRLLGRGGMGEVYEAYDTVRERRVAVKLLPPHLVHDKDFRERFERESKTAARLSDPHVIPIHDWGEIDGVLFIDMRLVDGRDLRKVLESGTLAPERALDILGQVASALDAAHRDGLVHRDIKPDNVLVDADDFAYLVDFGIAQGATDSRLTQTGTALGTLAYMAPERFGDQPAGPSSDDYALACVLFECIHGQTPFPAKTDQGLMTAHLTKAPPQTGGPLDPVFARALAKDPAQRYDSAREFIRAAKDALAAGPAPRPASPETRVASPRPLPPTTPAYTPPPSVTPPPGAPARGSQSGPQAGPSYGSGPHHGSGPRHDPAQGNPSVPNTSGPHAHSHGGPRYPAPAQADPYASVPPHLSGPHAGPGGQWGSAPTPAGTKTHRNIVFAVLAGVVVIALAVTGVVVALSGSGDDPRPPAPSSTAMPAGTVECTYPSRSAVGGVEVPPPASAQPNTGTVDVEVPIAAQGTIGMTLDRADAPCNVGAMVSLIESGFYDGSKCHRASDKYLICGSSAGQEGTNPGWTSPDELPTNLRTTGTEKGVPTVVYPRGTVAILDLPDDGGATGSTTFFMLAKDTTLPLSYSIVGTMDTAGLAVLDTILANGFTPSRPGAQSGPPNQNLLIQKVRISD
ncbi:protein kinase domain-containing protein [Gordonia paraffinivorans]|uniref:protein kinase domain-containing protein n=1 Tax=Gordonia paraffinivorans TaxID=175628 RepID=UPI003FCD6914